VVPADCQTVVVDNSVEEAVEMAMSSPIGMESCYWSFPIDEDEQPDYVDTVAGDLLEVSALTLEQLTAGVELEDVAIRWHTARRAGIERIIEHRLRDRN
jgi:hypothetical protein